jgi:hypothetical protein
MSRATEPLHRSANNPTISSPIGANFKLFEMELDSTAIVFAGPSIEYQNILLKNFTPGSKRHNHKLFHLKTKCQA